MEARLAPFNGRRASRLYLAAASYRHCRFFYGRYIPRPARFALYEMNLSDIILTPRYLSRSLSLSGRNAVMYGFIRCS